MRNFSFRTVGSILGRIALATWLIGMAVDSRAGNFSPSSDGAEVTDTRTGLIWRRCPEGMDWQVDRCSGAPIYFMWYEALQHAQAQSLAAKQLWRVPNIKELASLLDRKQSFLAIDADTFPGATNDQYWSSTPYAADAFYGWIVHFFYGSVYFTYLEDLGALMLVRDPS